MVDANPFYSTVVQSSAVIVAIIAAVVTADVVNLNSRRAAIHDEIRTREESLEANRTKAEELRCQSLERAHFNEIMSWNPLPTETTEVRRRLGVSAPPGSLELISSDSLDRWWSRLQAEIGDADGLFSRYPIAGESSFGAWRARHRREISDIPERKERIGQQRFNLIWSEQAHHRDSGRISAPRPAEFDVENLARHSELRALETANEQIQREIGRLEEKRIELAAPPPTLKWGLLVLGFVAVSGIAPSLYYMPQDPGDYDRWDKFRVLIGFATGLLIGIGYLVHVARIASMNPRR